VRHRAGDNQHKSLNADRRSSISKDVAEKETHISHQQVEGTNVPKSGTNAPPGETPPPATPDAPTQATQTRIANEQKRKEELGRPVDSEWATAIRGLGLAMEEEGQIDPSQVRHLLAPKARREIVKKLSDDGLSQREIAEALGVSQPTVCNDLGKLVDKDLSETDKNLSSETPTPATPDAPTGSMCGYDDLHRIVREGHKFGCIYADPPWLYSNQGTRAASGLSS
jgi:DNA-binding CsgD family transcriptional regulator